MQQSTNNWLQWRHKGIGSSDAPVIMGVSPYKTRLELWKEKIQPQAPVESEGDFIKRKGHALEAKARAQYELETGRLFADPICAEKADLPWMRASLDGWFVENGVRRGVEIKYVGQEYFDKTNVLPDIRLDHYWQMIHQFVVTGAHVIDHVLITDNPMRMKIIVIEPDTELAQELVRAEQDFWELVQTREQPEMSDGDFKVMTKPQLKRALADYWAAKEEEKRWKEEKETAYEKIKEMLIHPAIRCDQFRILECERVGNVNWKSIPEVKALDEKYVDGFRGKPSKYLDIRISKGSKSPSA